MEYIQKQPGKTTRFFLGSSVLRIEYSSVTEGTRNIEFPLKKLSPTPDRGVAKNSMLHSIVAWVLFVAVMVAFSIFGLFPYKLQSFWDSWARWSLLAVPTAMLAAVGVLIFAPKQPYVVFRLSSGEPAFSITKTGRGKAFFDTFVQATTQRIELSAAGAEQVAPADAPSGAR